MNEWIIGAVLLPVIAAVFKKEIGGLWKAWSIYRARPFDEDRDPNTPSTCQVLNGATGKWGDIIIEQYVMSLKKSKRGVYLKYPTGEREKISLLDWADMRKRK